jgi:2-polyprenyl-3-methyl-5-hydroxy-6-metoxy-1,4-benzoquinol methylase
MDLHDYEIVAEYYDSYTKTLLSESQLTNFIGFHLELAEKYGGGGILDIACGTGNISIPLIQAGYTVHAFDISDAMINRFQSKIEKLDPIMQQRANISVQNMIDFTYNRPFSLAMIPASGFMHLTTPQDQKKTLLNINKHLIKGGILTFNTFDPDVQRIANNSNVAKTYRKRTEFETSDSHIIELYNSISYDPSNQLIEGEWKFIEYDEVGEKVKETEVPLRMRYTFRQEMKYLLELTGFNIEALYGSYDKKDTSYPSNLIWIASKV